MPVKCYEPRAFNSSIRDMIVSALRAVLETSDEHLDERLLEELKKRDGGFQGLEVPIFEEPRFRIKRGYKVDIYHPKQKIAIEIEKTEVKNVWKDLIKFSLGNRKGLIKHGVLIVPKEYKGKREKVHTKPYHRAIEIYEFIKNLYFGSLLIVGY